MWCIDIWILAAYRSWTRGIFLHEKIVSPGSHNSAATMLSWLHVFAFRSVCTTLFSNKAKFSGSGKCFAVGLSSQVSTPSNSDTPEEERPKKSSRIYQCQSSFLSYLLQRILSNKIFVGKWVGILLIATRRWDVFAECVSTAKKGVIFPRWLHPLAVSTPKITPRKIRDPRTFFCASRTFPLLATLSSWLFFEWDLRSLMELFMQEVWNFRTGSRHQMHGERHADPSLEIATRHSVPSYQLYLDTCHSPRQEPAILPMFPHAIKQEINIHQS